MARKLYGTNGSIVAEGAQNQMLSVALTAMNTNRQVQVVAPVTCRFTIVELSATERVQDPGRPDRRSFNIRASRGMIFDDFVGGIDYTGDGFERNMGIMAERPETGYHNERQLCILDRHVDIEQVRKPRALSRVALKSWCIFRATIPIRATRATARVQSRWSNNTSWTKHRPADFLRLVRTGSRQRYPVLPIRLCLEP